MRRFSFPNLAGFFKQLIFRFLKMGKSGVSLLRRLLRTIRAAIKAIRGTSKSSRSSDSVPAQAPPADASVLASLVDSLSGELEGVFAADKVFSSQF